jgi:uncharacterized protein (TIGR00299 family) protein
MGKTLYLECGAGISGDMTVAALLDLGADQEVLLKALASLPVGGYEVNISRVSKSGLDACDFAVLLDAQHENHDHDMEYLHGHEPEHHHHHDHDYELEHHHHHDHDHELEHHHHHDQNHHHAHEHRSLPDILHIISHGDLTPNAKALAEKIFTILAEAESKAHGVPIEQVHFHEVGAVDSIVDIVAAAVCFDNLGITEVILPKLCEGTGFIRCQHGLIPVPVPATLNIVHANGLTLQVTDVEGELVTPTGAAIAAAVKTSGKLPASFRVVKTGIGAGKRQYQRPSLLRAMLIEDTARESDSVWKLETNIDDCSGEALGYAMERLLKAGAKDAFYQPIFMKKNRPAYLLTVLCGEEQISDMEDILFQETTTIGVRRVKMERTVLPRELCQVETSLGVAQVKICTLPNGEKRVYPEYDSVAALCKEHGISYSDCYRIIQSMGV